MYALPPRRRFSLILVKLGPAHSSPLFTRALACSQRADSNDYYLPEMGVWEPPPGMA